MSEEFIKKLEVDQTKIHNAVKYQLPIEITTYTLPRNMEIYIREVMAAFLKECHQEHMNEYLNFCNGELLTNAKKANTKRVYFNEKKLDINNPEDYEKGMDSFKEDTLTNIDHYLELQRKEGYYIKIVFQLKGEQIKVEIRNNATLTTFEKERINNKLESVGQYSTMEEVFTKVLDQSEGAGLGIIIIVLMLGKIGLSKENFQVISSDDETITRIVLPCNEEIFARTEMLTYEFVKLQREVPLLKSVYEKIKKIISEKTIDRQELANLAKEDSSLYLLLLKNSISKNSEEIALSQILAKYSDEEICQLFSEDKIGDKDKLKDEGKLFYLVDDDETKDQLWKHSNAVAQNAYNLVTNYPDLQTRLTAEEIYYLGLLNNIGNVFLSCATESQKQYILDLCKDFEDSQKMVDIFYSGTSNPRISMIYSKLLGLADDYAAIIGCWNNPDMSVPKNRGAAETLYIAEALQLYDEKLADFYQFNPEILKKIEITDEEQFKYLLGKIKEATK